MCSSWVPGRMFRCRWPIKTSRGSMKTSWQVVKSPNPPFRRNPPPHLPLRPHHPQPPSAPSHSHPHSRHPLSIPSRASPEEADDGPKTFEALAAFQLIQLVHELDRAHLSPSPPPASSLAAAAGVHSLTSKSWPGVCYSMTQNSRVCDSKSGLGNTVVEWYACETECREGFECDSSHF